MIRVADIATNAYRLLGRPQQSDLHYMDLLDAVRDVIRGRKLDMKMAARNHSLSIGAWVTPTGREMSALPFTGGESDVIPSKMEWRYLTDPIAVPRKTEIVSYESLTDLYRKTAFTDSYAAFYNGNTEIAFADPVEVLQTREYRLIYESTADVTTELADTTDLPDLFVTLCAYEAAYTVLDQHYNTTPEWAEKRERLRASLGEQLNIWQKRFDKWRTSLFGNRKVKKLGFRPGYR